MKNYQFAIVLFLVLSACSKAPESNVNDKNLRTNASPVDSMISSMRVMRNDQLSSLVDGNTILSAESGDASKFLKTSKLVDERTVYVGKFPTDEVAIPTVDSANDTLILGLPLGSLGEERVLGGVIVSVSNQTNEDLGNLKLSDFPMVHGKLMLAALNTNTPQLVLVGCSTECKESSPRVPQIAFPITAVDTQNKLLMIDISTVGKNLDLITMQDPTGEGTGLKSISTVAKTFDYSLQTVIFDVESKLTAVDPKENPMPDTNLTVRWYLKSTSVFDSAFESRDATPGVGFFMTDTAAAPKIKRWSLARYGDAGIKYYLKHVPQEWQPTFASAFDEWNDTFQKILGRKIFDYEFIPEGDVRNDLIITGDIRYNVVEWDLSNLATYGGLGLEDPLDQRNDFEDLPPNVDFKTYMNGYFHDMLTHELGHNLGLRHNFRGNMGATDAGGKGSTSRSVMEYLGRPYRYLDGVGEYDFMAIKYGYANIKPDHLDWFCTDENSWNPKKPETSPECTADDATSDPFTFYEFRFAKTIEKLTARGQSYAPVWTMEDMARELGVAMKGLLSYASITEKNALLTNFYGKLGRPADLKAVKDFVVARVKQQLCDPGLDLVIAGKYDPAAQKLTHENVLALREKVLDYFQKAGINLGFNVNCAQELP